MDKPIPVIFVEECEIQMRIWTRTDAEMSVDEFHLNLGQFVANAMIKIRQECKRRGVNPCMHIVPRVLTMEQFAELDGSTSTGELARMIEDVERNNRS